MATGNYEIPVRGSFLPDIFRTVNGVNLDLGPSDHIRDKNAKAKGDEESPKSFPRIILRDKLGRELDTFTSLQEAIYRAKWKVKQSGRTERPCEWRLPKAPPPARPDYTRTFPPLKHPAPGTGKLRALDNNGNTHGKVMEFDVDDVGFVQESLSHLPFVPSLSFLRQEILIGPKTYFQIVGTMLLHRRILSQTEKRQAIYNFPGFCSGCMRMGLCYGCARSTQPHYHEDKPVKTGGGFTYFKRDRPENEIKSRNPTNWKILQPDLTLKLLMEEYAGVRLDGEIPDEVKQHLDRYGGGISHIPDFSQGQRSQGQQGQDGDNVTLKPEEEDEGILPDIKSGQRSQEEGERSGTKDHRGSGSSDAVRTEDIDVVLPKTGRDGSYQEKTGQRTGSGRSLEQPHADAVLSARHGKGKGAHEDFSRSGRDGYSDGEAGQAGWRKGQGDDEVVHRLQKYRDTDSGSEDESVSEEDGSEERVGRRRGRGRDGRRRERLYKAPRPFVPKKSPTRRLEAKSPFSTDREYDLPKGKAFVVKKSNKGTTQFVDFRNRDVSWKAPKKFELKRQDQKTTKFWSPPPQRAKKREKKYRSVSPVNRNVSPDSGLDSEFMTDSLQFTGKKRKTNSKQQKSSNSTNQGVSRVLPTPTHMLPAMPCRPTPNITRAVDEKPRGRRAATEEYGRKPYKAQRVRDGYPDESSDPEGVFDDYTDTAVRRHSTMQLETSRGAPSPRYGRASSSVYSTQLYKGSSTTPGQFYREGHHSSDSSDDADSEEIWMRNAAEAIRRLQLEQESLEDSDDYDIEDYVKGTRDEGHMHETEVKGHLDRRPDTRDKSHLYKSAGSVRQMVRQSPSSRNSDRSLGQGQRDRSAGQGHHYTDKILDSTDSRGRTLRRDQQSRQKLDNGARLQLDDFNQKTKHPGHPVSASKCHGHYGPHDQQMRSRESHDKEKMNFTKSQATRGTYNLQEQGSESFRNNRPVDDEGEFSRWLKSSDATKGQGQARLRLRSDEVRTPTSRVRITSTGADRQSISITMEIPSHDAEIEDGSLSEMVFRDGEVVEADNRIAVTGQANDEDGDNDICIMDDGQAKGKNDQDTGKNKSSPVAEKQQEGLNEEQKMSHNDGSEEQVSIATGGPVKKVRNGSPPLVPQEVEFDHISLTSAEPDLELEFNDVIDVENLEIVEVVMETVEDERKRKHRKHRHRHRHHRNREADRTDQDKEVKIEVDGTRDGTGEVDQAEESVYRDTESAMDEDRKSNHTMTLIKQGTKDTQNLGTAGNQESGMIVIENNSDAENENENAEEDWEDFDMRSVSNADRERSLESHRNRMTRMERSQRSGTDGSQSVVDGYQDWERSKKRGQREREDRSVGDTDQQILGERDGDHSRDRGQQSSRDTYRQDSHGRNRQRGVEEGGKGSLERNVEQRRGHWIGKHSSGERGDRRHRRRTRRSKHETGKRGNHSSIEREVTFDGSHDGNRLEQDDGRRLEKKQRTGRDVRLRRVNSHDCVSNPSVGSAKSRQSKATRGTAKTGRSKDKKFEEFYNFDTLPSIQTQLAKIYPPKPVVLAKKTKRDKIAPSTSQPCSESSSDDVDDVDATETVNVNSETDQQEPNNYEQKWELIRPKSASKLKLDLQIRPRVRSGSLPTMTQLQEWFPDVSMEMLMLPYRVPFYLPGFPSRGKRLQKKQFKPDPRRVAPKKRRSMSLALTTYRPPWFFMDSTSTKESELEPVREVTPPIPTPPPAEMEQATVLTPSVVRQPTPEQRVATPPKRREIVKKEKKVVPQRPKAQTPEPKEEPKPEPPPEPKPLRKSPSFVFVREPTPPPPPELPPIEIPELPEYKLPEKSERKTVKSDRRTIIEVAPEVPEPKKKLRGPPKLAPRIKSRSTSRRHKVAEAPVTTSEIKQMTDPLDFLAKYCIINPERLPYYERVFNGAISVQTPRYSRVPDAPRPGAFVSLPPAQLSRHELNMLKDLTVLSHAQSPIREGLTPPEQYLEKLNYSVELLEKKREVLAVEIYDLQAEKTKHMADLARQWKPEIGRVDFKSKTKKKKKKKKRHLEDIDDVSDRTFYPRSLKDITDEVIVSRIDDKMRKKMKKDPTLKRLRLQIQRKLEKDKAIEERLRSIDDEKDVVGLYCMDYYFSEQEESSRPAEFRRQQSRLYQKLHPDPDIQMNMEEVEAALQLINNHLITQKEVQYLYLILNLPMREKINFRLFSIIAALSEKVTQMDPVIRKLINKFDYNALDLKMEKSKELFGLLQEGDALPMGNALASNLAVELAAGGLTPEHTSYVLSKFNREGRGFIDFLDFVTYVPLFIEIHQRIIADPLNETLNI